MPGAARRLLIAYARFMHGIDPQLLDTVRTPGGCAETARSPLRLATVPSLLPGEGATSQYPYGGPPQPQFQQPRQAVTKTRKSTSHGFHLVITI